MGKFDHKNGCLFLFSDQTLIYFLSTNIHLWYQTDDIDSFMRFDSETKKFEEGYGFGRNDKNPDPDWWKDSGIVWKEMEN